MPTKASSASIDLQEVSLAECAAIFGKAQITLKTWFNQGCPVIKRGSSGVRWRISPAAVAAWREEKIAQEAVGDTANLDYEEGRRREMAAKAAMLELDLAQRRGEVVEIEQIADLVGDEYANVRAKLLAIPVKLAPVVLGVPSIAEVRALIENAIIEAMEELTADGIYSSESSAIEGAEEAPAES